MATALARGLAVGAFSSVTREGLFNLLQGAKPGVVEFIAHGSAALLQDACLSSSLSENIGNILGSYAGTLLAIYIANQFFHQIDSGETRATIILNNSNTSFEGSNPEIRRAHLIDNMYFKSGMTGLIASCTLSAYKASKGSLIATLAGGFGAFYGVWNYLRPVARNRRA